MVPGGIEDNANAKFFFFFGGGGEGGGKQGVLSFETNFSSFSLPGSPPRDLQITAYK